MIALPKEASPFGAYVERTHYSCGGEAEPLRIGGGVKASVGLVLFQLALALASNERGRCCPRYP